MFRESKSNGILRVAVIGAGISGISTCYKLEKLISDVQIDLFEADEEPFGKVRTLRKDGFLIEAGPDCFVKEKPVPIAIAKELGFENEIIGTLEENKGTFIYAGKKLHPLPEGVISFVPTKIVPFLKTGLFSLKAKARMALDLFIPRANIDDETLAGFVRRRLGKEALDRLAAPLVAGIYGADPEKLSLKATFPRFLEMERKHRSLIIGFINARKKVSSLPNRDGNLSYFLSFKEGMSKLPEEMLRSLKRTRLHLKREVSMIEKEGQLFVVSDSNGVKERFDAVVIAVPSYVAAQILPENLKKAKSLLQEIEFNSVATVSMVFKSKDVNSHLKGHGFVVAEGEDLKISAATFFTNKWPYRAPEGYSIVRTFIGGGKKSYLAFLSDDELLKISLEDLRTVVGITDAEPCDVFIYRFIKAMPQYSPGHLERIGKINNEVEKTAGLYLTGSSYHGIGVPDCINQGFLTAEKLATYLNARNK